MSTVAQHESVNLRNLKAHIMTKLTFSIKSTRSRCPRPRPAEAGLRQLFNHIKKHAQGYHKRYNSGVSVAQSLHVATQQIVGVRAGLGSKYNLLMAPALQNNVRNAHSTITCTSWSEQAVCTTQVFNSDNAKSSDLAPVLSAKLSKYKAYRSACFFASAANKALS